MVFIRLSVIENQLLSGQFVFIWPIHNINANITELLGQNI